MGHFTIRLPDNRLGDVRWGKVRKLELPFRWLFRKGRDVQTGYIVRVSPAKKHETEYRLFKAKDGNWYLDADGTVPVKDATALAIKEAIEQRNTIAS